MFTSKACYHPYEQMIAGYYRSRIYPHDSPKAPNPSYRQLRVKDLPKVPTWWLEVESNQR